MRPYLQNVSGRVGGKVPRRAEARGEFARLAGTFHGARPLSVHRSDGGPTCRVVGFPILACIRRRRPLDDGGKFPVRPSRRDRPRTLKDASAFASMPTSRAVARHFHGDRQGADPSALHELPSGRERPLQGAGEEHQPPVWREDAADALSARPARPATPTPRSRCTEATTYESIPGHPRWGLAPLSMAWEGKTLGDIAAS